MLTFDPRHADPDDYPHREAEAAAEAAYERDEAERDDDEEGQDCWSPFTSDTIGEFNGDY